MAINNFLSTASDASLGQDLDLEPEETGGDFVVGPDMDIGFVAGYENLRSALLRRLITPLGSISTYVYDTTGLLITDQLYGNGSYRYLSEPLSSTLIATIKNEMNVCLLQESRIQVQSIDAKLVTTQGQYQVLYTINYVTTGTSNLEVLSLLQAGNSITPQ